MKNLLLGSALRFGCVAIVGLVALLGVMHGDPAASGAGPFFVAPSPTKECANVLNCVAVTGPWIVVPAHGEVTFLFGCHVHRGFIIGGTDARASSKNIQIWFDGRLGAPIGTPPGQLGAELLFHADSQNGKEGAFQPILGCVSLYQTSKRSTVSARSQPSVPGTSPAPALDLHARKIPEIRELTTSLRCGKRETLVSAWNAKVFDSVDPPRSSYAAAISVGQSQANGTAEMVIRMNLSRLFYGPPAWVQIGVVCRSA